MPLFLSEEELQLLSNDAAAVADRADAFIHDLLNQLDVVRAESDAKTISEEQNCAILEQKYAALHSEFSRIQQENTQLSESTQKCLAELADVQSEKHQLHIKLIGRDGEVEKLSVEASELHKSLRQLMQLVEQKDAEISERNVTIQGYVEKIVHLSENNSSKDSKFYEVETELTRCQAACRRLTQEKELLEKQNVWLDEELSTKTSNLFELRKRQMEVEADLSAKISDFERQVKEHSIALNHSKDRVKELELRVKSLEEDLCSSRDIAATTEEHFTAELSTVNKLVELYKSSSDEWSKKAGELEGVIKALETHLAQVEDDYKEKLEKETSLRAELQKEVADLKTKLGKCEAELESTRKANESSLLPWSTWPIDSHEKDLVISDSGSDFSQTLVPRIATGVSGTALAASLLRDGWSLTKMYEKYQEASDALLHEKWGRKHAEAVLERVLHEIEEKAEMILEERVEHERMVESYTSMAEKLQQALMEHDNYENNLRKLKAELRRLEREDSIAQKEIHDLQKQVTILLKECQDVQLRCGGSQQRHVDNTLISNVNSDVINAGAIISDNNFTFKDINELVELNAKLKSAVHRLSIDAEKKEAEFRDNFQVEFQRVADAATSKVEVVLKRSEEQASMIESLHSSVAMYKRLYEEEHKFRTSSYASAVAVPDDGKKELMLLFEGSQEISKKAYDQLCTRAKALEEDVARLSSEIISARTERDKMSLEASFAKERLASFMKEFDNQRVENTGVSARNMELTHLLIDYQKRVRESSASLQASEDNARKLSMEVSILKHEREIFVNSEKRMTDEIQSLRERVHRLQSSLDTVQSSEEVRESARATERRNQDDYLKRVERDLAEAKRELQEERDRFRVLALEKERAIESSMNQVEDIRKELANAWHVVATAESRAAVAEARSSDLDAKIKSIGTQAITEVDKQEQPSFSNNEISEDLWKTKEELHKIKDEAHANREYMLQYKEMARTNEIALKQIELAYEDYKSEAVKMKGVLENEVQSLKNQISELERKYMLKCEEAALATEAKEEVISSAMIETSILRDEIQEKTKRVTELESHVSFLKDDLDKEHRRWRNAQDNYERQIILQSETIQELTSTSKELSVMQTEMSRIRSILDAQKAENDLLKSSWETEKSEMQQSKTEAERKCNEMDEQNKILHNRLEALHVRLSEKDHNSAGHLSVNSPGDGDLQNVISYLRRSKEIAETEITLLKQEKLRLQTKVEGALKASESAQALLHSQLENARELLLKDDEFKSLQLQVREINLLRESNVQLREENKHNFEECQKFRQEAQNAKVEADKLENCLKQKQAEFNALQKEADLLKIEICNLNNRNAEILESCKDVNTNEFEQMKDELAQVKVSLAKKLELITKLEQDLSGCHEELSEREKKLNDAQQAEKTLKRELEKQKKILFLWKNKYQSIVKLNDELSSKNEALTKEVEDLKTINQAILREKEEMKSRNQVLTKEKDDGSTKAQLSAKEKDEFMSKAQALAKEKDEFMSKAQALAKEKEEISFKNQALLKQIEDLKLGRKVSVESEKAKKEQEKDTRIQMLEKTLERVRDDHRNEKLARKKSQTTMIDLANRVSRDKQKVEDELQKHKSAVSIVLEKAGALASQLPAGSFLDERTLTYFQSVSSFEAAAVSFLGDTEVPHGSPAIATLDNSSTSTGQQVSTQLIKLPARPSTKPTDEREKASTSGKTVVEVRKPGRRFVRPSLEKTEDPSTDAEIAGTETCSAADGRASSSVENESLVPSMGARKRSASSEPEILEASSARDEGTVVSAPPPSKKTKESEFSEASEAYVPPLSSENLDAARLQGVPTSEISEMDVLQSKEDPIEEYLEVGKEDEGGVPVNEESEEQQQDYLDAANPNETHYEGDAAIEESSDRVDAPTTEEEAIDQAMKIEEIKEILFSSPEVEEGKDEGKEEGELMMEDETEQQPEDIVSEEGQLGSVAGDGSGSGDEVEDALDIASPDEQVARDPTVTDVEDVAEDSDKRSNSGIDRGALDSAPSPSISVGAHEEPQNISAETGESQVVRTSTTISISEAAKRNARNRQARMATPAEPPVRLRRPPLRREGTDGKGHGGRG